MSKRRSESPRRSERHVRKKVIFSPSQPVAQTNSDSEEKENRPSRWSDESKTFLSENSHLHTVTSGSRISWKDVSSELFRLLGESRSENECKQEYYRLKGARPRDRPTTPSAVESDDDVLAVPLGNMTIVEKGPSTSARNRRPASAPAKLLKRKGKEQMVQTDMVIGPRDSMQYGVVRDPTGPRSVKSLRQLINDRSDLPVYDVTSAVLAPPQRVLFRTPSSHLQTPSSSGSTATPSPRVVTPSSSGSISTATPSPRVLTPSSSGSISTATPSPRVVTPSSSGSISTATPSPRVLTPSSSGSISTATPSPRVVTPSSSGSRCTATPLPRVPTPSSTGFLATPSSSSGVAIRVSQRVTYLSAESVSTATPSSRVQTPSSGSGSVAAPSLGVTTPSSGSGSIVPTPSQSGYHQYASGVEKTAKKKTLKRKKPKRVHDNVLLQSIASKFQNQDSDQLCNSVVRQLKLSLSSRNFEALYTTLSRAELRDRIMRECALEIGERPDRLNHRTGNVSKLMMKQPNDLRNFTYSEIVQEMMNVFPELLLMCVCIMLKESDRTDEEKLAEILPRIATVYSILLFTRNTELSRLQRVHAICLLDHLCEKEVYLRLNRIAISSSYTVSLRLRHTIAGANFQLLLEAARAGKRIRFIGDNVDYQVKVKYERRDHKKHMEHLFVSAALVSDFFFDDEPNTQQITSGNFSSADLIFGREDYERLMPGWQLIIGEIIAQFLPQLSFVANFLPKNPFKMENPEKFAKKTQVIPLGVLQANEMKHLDCKIILDYYQSLATRLKAEGYPHGFQYGGDQMTRGRFSETKVIMAGSKDPKVSYEDLKYCTFEWFHAKINYMEKLVYLPLWNYAKTKKKTKKTKEKERKKAAANSDEEEDEEDEDDEDSEEDDNAEKEADYDSDENEADDDDFTELEVQPSPGSMRGAAEYVSRQSIYSAKVKEKYKPCTNFFLSYFKANVIEAALNYFGMESREDSPKTHPIPATDNPIVLKSWVVEHLSKIIDQYCLPYWTRSDSEQTKQVSNQVIRIDGQGDQYMQTVQNTSPDYIKNYHHYALEAGLTFSSLEMMMKSPNRSIILSVTRLLLMQVYGRSTKSKYAIEYARFLILQLNKLSVREACETLQGCFVNTTGTSESFIPADLRVEWMVREEKKILSHLCHSGEFKTVSTLSKAVPYIREIADNFDEQAGTADIYMGGSNYDYQEDERLIMDLLRKLKPFDFVEGRQGHTGLPTSGNRYPGKSYGAKVDGYGFMKFFNRNYSRARP